MEHGVKQGRVDKGRVEKDRKIGVVKPQITEQKATTTTTTIEQSENGEENELGT